MMLKLMLKLMWGHPLWWLMLMLMVFVGPSLLVLTDAAADAAADPF